MLLRGVNINPSSNQNSFEGMSHFSGNEGGKKGTFPVRKSGGLHSNHVNFA